MNLSQNASILAILETKGFELHEKVEPIEPVSEDSVIQNSITFTRDKEKIKIVSDFAGKSIGLLFDEKLVASFYDNHSQVQAFDFLIKSLGAIPEKVED